MRVLFIGGTGTISSACAELAVARGIELALLTRGDSTRPIPDGATAVRADVRDADAARRALGDRRWDAVVDWVSFTPAHVRAALDLVGDRTSQYVFISSASAYQKPPLALPIVESTPLANPHWQYSRDKIACEELLQRAYRDDGVPTTIVRPSHTYDRRSLPMFGRYTVIDRMRRGRPVVVHGDGTSLWVLTHHRDFAVGLVGLLGNDHAIGGAFHITSDELLTWNQIHRILASAAGAEAELVHVPSERIARYDADWGASLLGDKMHSVVFDNSRIRQLVPVFRPSIPFSRGAEEIMAWYDGDPARRQTDAAVDALMDRIIADHR